MRTRCLRYPAVALALALCGNILADPAKAFAKVFFYAIGEEDGALIKYDPDADRIVERTLGARQAYINRRNPDADNLSPTRVLDVARGRIVTFFNRDPGVVLLDLGGSTPTEIAVAPAQSEFELRHLVYPRQGSRFYGFWVRTSSDPPEPLITALDLGGRILGTTSSPIAEGAGFSLSHSDGRTFYVLNEPNEVLRVDGETLAVRERHDVSTFYRAGVTRRGIVEVRDGRALLVEREDPRTSGLMDPAIVLTVDLAMRTASPRITTGLGTSTARLASGGRTMVLQEARTPDSSAGAGRLHFYDVASGNKQGEVTFRADRGAVLLGFHPDGRRLFLRAWNVDSSGDLEAHLVIVDVVTRTVIRHRPFEKNGVAVDFVDEP